MASPASNLIVDASVATKWHLTDEDEVEKALLVLERFANGEIVLWAPEQIRYEVPSAITAATLGSQPRVSREVARQSIEKFLALGLSVAGSSTLMLAAFDLVHQQGCAFYDALYLALAEEMGLPFITADWRLYLRIRQLPYVIWLGDYS
jgi:predicted nucleic acid-binding protein